MFIGSITVFSVNTASKIMFFVQIERMIQTVLIRGADFFFLFFFFTLDSFLLIEVFMLQLS